MHVERSQKKNKDKETMMILRTWPLTLALIAVMGLTFLGCQSSGDPLAPPNTDGERNLFCDPPPPPPVCGDMTEVTLIAGQKYDAGVVTVGNDSEYLYVTFSTSGGWVLTETQVAVATSLDGIPQTKKGSPQIGKFPFKAVHDPPVTEYTYTIELEGEGWDICDELYIATHAVVRLLGSGGKVKKEETGWGEGDPFDKGWAMYFNFEVQSCCVEGLYLPTDLVTAQYFYPGPSSYWKIVLGNVPDGYSVADGEFLGWCVDKGHYIYPGSTHNVTLYSSYDPAMPSYAQDDDWDMVNYVINHKHPNATIIDIQKAIWYFINGGTYPSDPEAQEMVDDAIANGEGFEPSLCLGQVIAVILDPDTNTMGKRSQLTFIEVVCLD